MVSVRFRLLKLGLRLVFVVLMWICVLLIGVILVFEF